MFRDGADNLIFTVKIVKFAFTCRKFQVISISAAAPRIINIRRFGAKLYTQEASLSDTGMETADTGQDWALTSSIITTG